MPLKPKKKNTSRCAEDIFDPSISKAFIVKNLVKEFDDVVAVDGINFEVENGEIFGFLGPNGAGKSTTINMLCGLVTPTEGTAIIKGYDIRRDMEEIRKMIGVCPQIPAIIKHFNARENLALFGNLHTMPKELIKERIDILLDVMGLSEASKRRVKGYSGGMVRRLNFIISLISDPQIIFLDEPTVGMDAKYRRTTWDYIANLKNQGKTIILTTHYLEESEKLSDRVGIIDEGKIIALDTPQELMKKHDAVNLEEVFVKITGKKFREEVY